MNRPPAEFLGKYPGNGAVYDRLRDLLADRSAMAFIGAGASFPLYPLWGQLIEQLASEAIHLGLAGESDKAYWLRNAASKPLQIASQIRSKLGEAYYHTFLYETFKLKLGPDGKGYTPTQAALMRMGFKAYLTTNYDPGLTEARREMRPEIRETEFTVWNQNFKVNRWASGDIFREESPCPVLFAHGHFADPPSIVLDHASYRKAYHDTPYRRLFENLWFQEHLVFVGFSFNDIALTQIGDEVLWQTARQQGGAPRHIAIVGLSDDECYTEQMRHEYLEAYHAEVIFYPVAKTLDGRPDHCALQVLLEFLAPQQRREGTPAPPTYVLKAPAPNESHKIPACFAHVTTEDENFIGRTDALARLDSWAADPSVRLIAICGMGGLGKTALAARWMRTRILEGSRCPEGSFFWSFFRNPDLASFFEGLLDFAGEELSWTPSAGNVPPADRVLELLRTRRLVVTLDGLEVLQEAPDTVAYGKLLNYELAEFLNRLCKEGGDSLAFLTSRFPFPDLTPHIGSPMRLLALPALTDSEGAALLEALGVKGHASDRELVTAQLAGHPLALRVFAHSIPLELRGDPTRLWSQVFAGEDLTSGDPLEGKLCRLLTFYEAHLPQGHRRALGLLGLFRGSVGVKALTPLWEGLFAEAGSGDSLACVLEELQRDHLVTADPSSEGGLLYACHPILRDYFRAALLNQRGLARQAANLIRNQPDTASPDSLETVQFAAVAIELLLDSGEVEAANDLYRNRLASRKIPIWWLAPHLGMEVSRAFVRDNSRRAILSERLGTRRLRYYLNVVGFCADKAGEPETALYFLNEAIRVDREIPRDARDEDAFQNSSILLQNLGQVEISLGLLAEADRHFKEALELSQHVVDNDVVQVPPLAQHGYVESLRGELSSADEYLRRADVIGSIYGPEPRLCGLSGVYYAEHLLRTGADKQARRLTEVNQEIYKYHDYENWHFVEALCDWILGWLDLRAGRMNRARSHLEKAQKTFTALHTIRWLSRALVVQAELLLAQGDHNTALAVCERAHQLAAPRKYRLVQADSLNLRARIRLRSPDQNAALVRDDAESALQLAHFCGYAWAERDAWVLLEEAHRKLGNQADTMIARQRADAWNGHLRRKGGKPQA